MSPEARQFAHLVRVNLNSRVAWVWERFFRLFTRAPKQLPALWKPCGSDEVLLVAPHPDDETSGCAGALALHVRSGDSVTVVCVTDGTGSTALRGTAEERSSQRRQELEAALSVLGLDPVRSLAWLGLPERQWELEQCAADLKVLIESVQPSMIYTPSRIDFHPEHRKVASALALALERTSIEPIVRIYPVLVPLSSPPSNLHVPVSEVGEVIELALRAHCSQWGTIERTLSRRRYAAAAAHQSGLFEEYWQLDVLQYCRLHRTALPEKERFRGLRYDPWTDPLAYLVGRKFRSRLVDDAS